VGPVAADLQVVADFVARAAMTITSATAKLSLPWY
jgi:hypothetical protein